MTDPKRWSEGGDASEWERELLVAGQSARLPDTERRALWASIALSLPVAPPVPTTPPTPLAATSSLVAYLTKGAIFVVVAAGVGLGGARLLRAPKAAAPRATTPVVVVAAPSAAASMISVTEATPTEATPSSTASAIGVTAPSDGKARTSATSQLREESMAILEARAALRSGDAGRSLALLEQARVRFAHGALGQEREALTIQALAQSGERSAARRRAEAFLRAHPQSPYVADVRLVASP